MITIRTKQQSEDILVQHAALMRFVVLYVHFQNGYCHFLKLFCETDLLEEKDFE